MNQEQQQKELLQKLGLAAGAVPAELLRQALTHKSVTADRQTQHQPHNERLEFLGDAYLKASISEWLYTHLPDASEGDMTKIRAYVISDSAFSRVARRLELERYIIMSSSERSSQAEIRESIVANVFESLWGAIFLATDYPTTARLILEQVKPELELALKGEAEEVQNYKATLQEYAQGKYKLLPEYEMTHTDGPDHDRAFFVTVTLNGELLGEGEGRSKKRAEQDAARLALKILGSFDDGETKVPLPAAVLQFFEQSATARSVAANPSTVLPQQLYLAPSVLSADFSCLQTGLQQIEDGHAAWVHLDVMDGHFVPNLTFGPPLIKALRPHSKKVFDAHLMMSNPQDFLAEFAKAGCDRVTVHYEACDHLDRVVAQIKELGMKAGVSLNPATPVAMLDAILHKLDLVLLMSVNPGFGGQSFIPRALERIKSLVKLRASQELEQQVLIEVDGGIDQDTLPQVIQAGADVVVIGSAVFNTPDPVQTMLSFNQQLAALELQYRC